VKENKHKYKPVYVDLTKSRSATSFSEEGSFFEDELERTIALLNEILNLITDPVSDSSKNRRGRIDRLHQAITILGSRGVGKTSFILTLRDRLKEYDQLNKTLLFLNPIDPSLLEDSEFFLVTVISAICQFVEKTTRHGDSGFLENRPESSCYEPKDFWHKARVELLKHLVALDSNSLQTRLSELLSAPEVFAEEAMATGLSGRELYTAFDTFMECTIQLLRGSGYPSLKALVLPLDDIDAALRRGGAVLETIRKYLTTKRLVVIAAGDLPLFRLVAHLEIRNRLDSKNLEAIADLPDAEKALREAERSYLAKIFPAENRVIMTSPLGKIVRFASEYEKDFILIINNDGQYGNDNYIGLSEPFRKLCESLFWPISYQVVGRPVLPYNTAFPLLPDVSRDLIRFIKVVLKPCLVKSGSPSRSFAEDLAERLINFYSPLLLSYGFDPDELRRGLSEFRDRWLFTSLLKSEGKTPSLTRFERGYTLDENYASANKTRLLRVLQGVFNQIFSDYPIRMARYWLLVAEPWQNAMEHTGQDDNLLTQYLGYLRYESGDQMPDLHAWNICWQYRQKEKEEKTPELGPGWAVVSMDEGSSSRNAPSAFVRNFFSFVALSPQGPQRHISFVYGLSGLLETISLERLVPNSGDGGIRDLIAEQLARYSQIRYFPVRDYQLPKVYGSGETLSDSNGSESSTTNVEIRSGIDSSDAERSQLGSSAWWLSDTFFNDIVDLTSSWYKKYDYKIYNHNRTTPPNLIPVPVLAAIWRRFRFNLIHQSIELHKKKHTDEGASLGQLMRSAAKAFLNSILVEEAICKGKGQKLNRLPVELDGRVLEENLGIIQNENHQINLSEMRLFKCWAECPMIWLLLGLEKSLTTKLELVGVSKPHEAINAYNSLARTKL
jgi:hypothetical protein